MKLYKLHLGYPSGLGSSKLWNDAQGDGDNTVQRAKHNLFEYFCSIPDYF